MGVLPVLARSAVTLALTVALMPVVIRVLGGRILDEPNERSSHTVVTPRGGGIGPALAASAVLCAWWTGQRGRLFDGLVVACTALALLGLFDDIRRLPALVRLLGQVLVATVAAILLTSGMHSSGAVRLVVLVVAAGWLVAFVNAFNFMDGINGISSVTAAGAGGTWLVLGVWKHAGGLAVVGAVVAGAALGFLPFNFPHARIFLGDVGSYFFGALLGAGAVIGLRASLHPEAVLAPLELYVLDTGSTLVRRGLRRENILKAHREHVYQRICRAGWSHTATTAMVAGLSVAAEGMGIVAQASGRPRFLADGAMLFVWVGYLLLPPWLGWHRKMARID